MGWALVLFGTVLLTTLLGAIIAERVTVYGVGARWYSGGGA
jgi:hypothetical protein